MSRSENTTEGGRYAGTRLETTQKKRKAKMRSEQLGYDSFSEYLRDLIDQDLEDAPDALHELVEESDNS